MDPKQERQAREQRRAKDDIVWGTAGEAERVREERRGSGDNDAVNSAKKRLARISRGGQDHYDAIISAVFLPHVSPLALRSSAFMLDSTPVCVNPCGLTPWSPVSTVSVADLPLPFASQSFQPR